MRRTILVLAPVLVLSLAGCNTSSQRDRALGGGAIGAATGAVVGGVATDSAGGAVVGGVLGGATGAMVGAATTPKNCVDRYGRAVACP